MKELIEKIEAQIAEAVKLETSAFRDVAIGAFHSAIHGIRTAEENLGWHQVKMEEKAKAGTVGPAKAASTVGTGRPLPIAK